METKIPYDKHIFYDESVEHAEALRRHFDGSSLGDLITKRRPAESKDIQDYREEIFRSKTQGPCTKILNALKKIRKSSDWNIRFNSKIPFKIPEDSTLEKFTDGGFHKWKTMENWYFSTAFRVQCIDANALVLWMPKEVDLLSKKNQIKKPFPVIYGAEKVIAYEEGSWYVLKSVEVNKFTENGREIEGEVYYYVDEIAVSKNIQINSKGDFKKVWSWEHLIKRCPITFLYGELHTQEEKNALYKSHIHPIIPEFDEAGREYSDLQAEIVQHIHSTMWAYEAQKCKTCKGASFIRTTDTGPMETCPDCHGLGRIPFNSYEHLTVSPPKAGDPLINPPFAGYIEKSTEIATLQDKRIQDHIYYGLAAINMEHLAQVPLVQSGIAKEYDKSEASNFVYTVGEDVVRNLTDAFKVSNDIMFAYLIPDESERDTMLPRINTPEKFDMFPESYFTDELKKLKESGAATSIIREAQIEIAAKKFNTDPLIMKKVKAQLTIDPFGGVDESVIDDRKLNQGVNDLDYLVHCNIAALIEDIIQEDDTFLTKPLVDQKKAVYEKAKLIQITPVPIDGNPAP